MQVAGIETEIPYSKINLVKLSKTNGASYKMTVKAENSPDINITNKYYLPTGEFEDRSPQYTNFVRIFHHHMKGNTHSVFLSTYQRGTLLLGMLLAAFVSVFISFVGEFFHWQLIDPILQAFAATTATAASIFVVNRKKNLNRYSPDKIPSQFLP